MRDNIASLLQKNETKLKLKTNIGTKLNHFDKWHNYGVTRVKNKKNSKKTIIWHVVLTLISFGQN